MGEDDVEKDIKKAMAGTSPAAAPVPTSAPTDSVEADIQKAMRPSAGQGEQVANPYYEIGKKKPSEIDDVDRDIISTAKTPDQIKQIPKHLPLTEDQLRTKFEHERSLPWNEGMKTPEDWYNIGKDIVGSGVSFVKGAKKFAENTFFSGADEDPSGWGNLSAQPLKDVVSTAVQLPEDVAYAATKLNEGGMGWTDRLSEKLGFHDKEKSYENYKARHLVDQVHAQAEMENPSIYGRIMKGDIANAALSAVVLNSLPDLQTIMEQDGLSLDQAKAKRKAMADQIAQQTTSEIAAQEKPADEDIRTLGQFALPSGLGLGEMGVLGLGAEAAGGLSQQIAKGLKYIGKTDDEIKAMNDAAQALQRSKQVEKIQRAQQPTLAGRAAGTLASGVEKLQQAAENAPQILKTIAPYAIGGALGYETDQQNPLLGAFIGAGIGHGAVPVFKAAANIAKIPALIRDIDEARALSAGGTRGTFETLGSFPDVSEQTAKILRFGGKRLDNIINNSVDYAKSGIHPTLLAVATGALDSADPEQMNQLVSQGLLYGLGGRAVHQAWGKIGGVDPIAEQRERRAQAVDDFKTYQNLDPESQKTLTGLTSWDNVVERHEGRLLDAQNAYSEAVRTGSADAQKLGQDVIAQKNVLSAVKRANVQTRNEFGRQFLTQLTRLNELTNGTLRAGQNNVGIHILAPDQIFAKFRQDPANNGMSDADIMETANQQGFYSTPEGAVEYQAGMPMGGVKKTLIFDRTKPSIVINANHLKARQQIFGETPTEALTHEFGHHIRNIPEFKEANKEAEDLLFSQEIKDLTGKVVTTTSGQYSQKALVDMYTNDYMKGKTPDQIEQLSKLAGLWDASRGQLDEQAVANYMRDEIVAELNADTLSSHLGTDLDSGSLRMLDVARLKTKKNLLDRAVQKFLGNGGKGDPVSELTGATFSPEVVAANRQAMRALQALQGEVSPAVKAPDAPKISRAMMMKNRALQEVYGKYSGLFKTEMVGQMFDAAGNPVGGQVKITNPSASEGVWAEDRQMSGYGQKPDELSTAPIPAGGRLVVSKEIVRQPDGVTPVMYSPSELKKLQIARKDTIMQALDTPDHGTPNRFQPVSDGSQTWRGTFTPLQIEAIKNLPESIVSRSIKEHILKIHDALQRGDGSRMIVDYAAVMNDSGKYTAYSPKHYDVVPIGMHLSKDGHFLVTTISVGRLFDKLNAWSQRMPARLAPWKGDKDAFFKEFTEKYLKNWQYREKDAQGNEMYPQGRAGEYGLSGTPEEALAKKKIFNDFLNLTTNEFRDRNDDRTTTPRRRGDVRGKDIDRTIMSMRLDHMAELMDNEYAPKVPVNYGNAIKNFLPDVAVVPETKAEEERKPSAIDLGITAAHSPESRPFSAQYVAPTAKYPTSEQGFYSGLQKVVDEKMPAKASPQQILSIVNNPQNAKADEVKWSNLEGFLEGKTSVTKAEVLDYLKNEGAIKFEEKKLGGNTINRDKEAVAREIAKEVSEDERKYAEFIDPDGVDNYSELTPEQRFENSWNIGKNDFLEEAGERIDRQEMSSPNGETKYSQYVLPNGENYREVVLTMPAKYNEAERQKRMQLLRAEGEQLDAEYTPDLINTDVEKYKRLIRRSEEIDQELRNLTLPKDEYTSSHFTDIPNYVAHMRLDERKDASGKDGLFIEEIQSDRHQQGREKGYTGDKDQELAVNISKQKENVAKMEELEELLYQKYGRDRSKWDDRVYPRDEIWHEWKKLHEINKLLGSEKANIVNDLVPDAPFRKDWSIQMFKRALRDAIEGDKEWIGWTKGETQFDRWGSQKFDWQKQSNGSWLMSGKEQFRGNAGGIDMEQTARERGQLLEEEGTIVNTYEDVLDLVRRNTREGKAEPVADKLWKRMQTESSGTSLPRKEGMEAFYDSSGEFGGMVKEIGKYVKKWGAKVEEGELDNRQPEDNAYYEDPKPEHFTPIWKVSITPEMRDSIQRSGQIQFLPSRDGEEERITAATYTNPRTGEVSEGATHLIANPNAPQEATDRESPAYGFKTSSGGIVDRSTAYQIAKDSGQLKAPTTEEEKFNADRGILHSGMYEPKGGISFMPADADHASAVERGDMEEAQRLVDEAAPQKEIIITLLDQFHYGDQFQYDEAVNLWRERQDSISGKYPDTIRLKFKDLPQGLSELIEEEAGAEFEPDERLSLTWKDANQVDAQDAPFIKVRFSDTEYENTNPITRDEAQADLERRYKEGDEKAYEEAQRLADEKAIANGYPITYPLYRGVRRKLNSQGVMQTQGGRATLSFTDVPEVAKLYTHDREMFGGIKPSEHGDVKKVYLNLKNPLDLREYGTKVNLGDMIEGYTNYDFRPNAEVDPETTFTTDDLKKLFTRFQKLENSTQFESDIQASDNEGLFRLNDFREVREAIEELIDDDDVDAPEKISDILNSIEVDTYALADNQWFIKGLKQKGYDGLIHKDTIEAGKEFFKEQSVAGKPIEEIQGIDSKDDFSHDTYRPFESSQIKLSDPFTYDNEGNLIPLSQRFDTTKNDIRFMPKSEEENREKLVAKYDDLIKSSSSKGSAVIERYPEQKNEDGDILSYETWVVSSTKNDKEATITNNNDGTFDVSCEDEGMIYGISYEQAESQARHYVETSQSQDQYNLLRDARSEIMHEIHIPPDMKLRDVRDTANDSIYYKIDHILSRDEDGDPDEKESYKLSIRNHDPSPFREQEFGANDYWVEVPKNPSPRDMANAVAKIEKWLADQSNQSNKTDKSQVQFMPYSPELPKTEDGKVDWEGFKTKTQETAKPLAGIAPIGGISFKPAQEIELDKPDAVQKAGVATKLPKKVPESGHYTIAMQPTDDGREVQYQVDPASTITPKVGSIEDIDGEQVGILEADRHTTRGDNMGGPLHPFLISNQVIARLLDGRGFKPVWANMNSAFVTRAKNIITNTTNGRALIQIMKEQAHKSNRKFVQDIMQEIDATKKNLSADEKDALHVILELGAKNPAKHLARVTKAAKLLKDGEITQSEFEMIKSQNADKIEKYGPQVEFLKKLGTMKSMATKGNRAGFDKAFKDHNDQFKNEDWYKKIVNKYKNTTFQDEASRFTFVERGAAMSRLDGIAFAPPISQRLADVMDFRGGKNLDLVASVQLSKDPDAFAIYTGKDPKQEAKMSKNERILRDQFMKDPNFRKHPSYDWMMLGPENADNFILEKPVDPMSLFPDYAKNHPKESVRNGSKETIVGTMKKSKIPLIIKTKK